MNMGMKYHVRDRMICQPWIMVVIAKIPRKTPAAMGLGSYWKSLYVRKGMVEKIS